MNILIVGAGPTGLTTALELARRGIQPTVVDAKDAPSTLSRAVGILPKSIATLDRTDVGDELKSAGVNIKRVNIYRDGRKLIDVDVSNRKAESFIIGLPQDETETIMSEKLSSLGVAVQYGQAVVNVTTSSQSATAVFAGGRQETYDWIIGADGIFSDVRESLGIDFAGYDLPETWSIADLDLPADAYNTHKITGWLLEGEREERDVMVLFPMGERRARLVSSTPDSVANLPIDLDITNVLHTGSFTISVRNASRYKKGRVLLAGDAAHVHSPVGGRGMNLGIDDGQAVASAVVTEQTEKYARERSHKGSEVIEYTERARKTLLSNNLVVGAGLKTAGWLISNTNLFKRLFVKQVTKL